MGVVEDRLLEQLLRINSIGATLEGGVTRLGYSAEEEEAVALVEGWMRELGLDVRRDAAGNLYGRRSGRADGPAVLTGSHLDSVPNGGKYDGAVGVLCALETARRLVEEDILTEHPVEVVVFRCEESSRFGAATLGSRAVAGTLSVEDLHRLRDAAGTTVAQAMQALGLDPRRVSEARRDPSSIRAFVEVHVEQGTVLETEGCPIGVVTHIAAPTRYRVRVSGEAAHSGATPMDRRRDALAAAAEIVLAVEQAAREESPNGTVGTVGVLTVRPGAMNVVPGDAEMGIDIRSIDGASKARAVARVLAAMDDVARRRGVKITRELLVEEEPAAMHPLVLEGIERAARDAGLNARPMASPAGHDAMHMARIAPAGMVFLPSRDGASHNPLEYTDIEDVAAGAEVLFRTVCRLAKAEETGFETAESRRKGA
ncbi:MAG: M20 family metallo-hydrolase [Firmicutes bacterium]|nr:M20 family metallo-hydrolase [Bacillota bacterium]